MANIKITDLDAYSDPQSTDVLPAVDVANDQTKKVSIADLMQNAGFGTAAAPGIAFDGDPNIGIYRPGADQLAISTAGTGRLFVGSSGNVGIGVNNPGSLLHIKSSSGNAQIQVEVPGGTGADIASITKVDSDQSLKFVASGGLTDKSTLFFSNTNNERARIDSSGRLLIGHTSSRAVGGSIQPIQNENTAATGISFVRNSPDALPPFIILGKSRGTTVGASTAVVANDNLGALIFAGADGTDVNTGAAAIYAQLDGTPGANNMPGRLIFFTAANGAASPTERMRLTSDGKLGLGTSSPDSTLKIETVGSNIPQSAFAIRQNNAADTAQTTLSVEIDPVNSTARILSNATSSPRLALYTSNQAALYIDESQQVGIGSTSPSQKLSVGTALNSDQGSFGISLGSTASNVARQAVIEKTTNSANLSLTIRSSEASSIGAPIVFETSSVAEAARIDSSGRLLVGTSSSRVQTGLTGQIQLEGTNNSGSTLQIINNNNSDPNGSFITLGKTRGTAVGGTTIVQNDDILGEIRFSGSDGTAQRFAASIETAVDGTPGASDMPGRLVFSTTADGASSPTERMSITNEGYIFPDSASRSQKASIASTANRGFRALAGASTAGVRYEGFTTSTGTAYHIAFSNPNGIVGSISTNASATAYNTSSDYRLKENVVPLTGAINRVNQLQVHRFNFIADPDKTVDGFLAHEAQAVVPECVTGTKDEVDADGNPVYQGIDQSKLVPLLTAALQEALAKIETLEARITALEGN